MLHKILGCCRYNARKHVHGTSAHFTHVRNFCCTLNYLPTEAETQRYVPRPLHSTLSHNQLGQHLIICSTPSQYPLLIGCPPFSSTNHLLIENHRSLIQVCITPSLESTPWFFPSASPVMSRLTSSFTCQLVSIIITTLIIHHSFILSPQAQNLFFQQSLPP